ncbi:hypothetical protein [Microvirga thermotolerans]|uniref:Uncharacterized protein n=1 Tax=Microvirga thermotolerans TaxID=2651334 RepID=A0A5P9K4G9_9HYPH|nr:hypothetical protein [Microvirga thermotolerans]QFU17294.1 hypothetical protein GDR74_14280 [Microvirga thermotolerans]
MPEPFQRTVLTDIDIPFASLVPFFVKAALAAIPATFVVAPIGRLFRLLFGIGTMDGTMG